MSIGVPVYDGERYLAEALDSILAQDFGDFELIISDNASSDGTQEICEAYARRDQRIHYSRLPENLGAARNYNRLVEMSNAPLFKWATHDDLIKPTFLSGCVETFRSFSEQPPALVHPRAEFIDENGQVTSSDLDRMRASSDQSWIRAFQTLQAMNMTAPIAGVFHKETLKKTRLIGSFSGSDYVLLLETGLLGKIVQLEGEPLFQRRIHTGMSRKANLSDRDVLSWFDPAARPTLSPRRKLYLEYLRSPVRVIDANWVEKALCMQAIVCGVSVKKARVFVGKHRRLLMSRLSADRV